VGFLERAELDALLRRARVYISAAKYDPFGLLPLQAALNGCALLLSDIPSYREVWGGSVTYFKANVDDLRRKWRTIQADSRAYERAKTLNAERMVDQYRDVYARLSQAVAA